MSDKTQFIMERNYRTDRLKCAVVVIKKDRRAT